jgi:hypothetical protein
VDAADEGPLSAADEAHAEFAVERRVGRHGRSSGRGSTTGNVPRL